MLNNFTLGEILKNLEQFSGTQNAANIPLPNQAQSPAQVPMPAMPASLGQSANAGGGIGNTLAGMAKSLLTTTAETLPPALVNYALFGDTPMGHRMTYASVVNQLEEKKRKAEERRQNRKADLASFLYSTQKWAKDNYNLGSEDVQTALFGGNTTGNPDFDIKIKEAQQALKPLIESGQIDAIDIWDAREYAAKYEDMFKEEPTDYELYQKNPEEYAAFKSAGKKPTKPKHELGDIRTVKGTGGKEFQEEVVDYTDEGTAVWGNRQDVTKPEKPIAITPNKIEAGIITKFLSGKKLTPQEQKIIDKYFQGGKDTYGDVKLRYKAKIDSFRETIGREPTEDEKRAMFISDPYGYHAPDTTTPSSTKIILTEEQARAQLSAKGVTGKEQDGWIKRYKEAGKVQ